MAPLPAAAGERAIFKSNRRWRGRERFELRLDKIQGREARGSDGHLSMQWLGVALWLSGCGRKSDPTRSMGAMAAVTILLPF